MQSENHYIFLMKESTSSHTWTIPQYIPRCNVAPTQIFNHKPECKCTCSTVPNPIRGENPIRVQQLNFRLEVFKSLVSARVHPHPSHPLHFDLTKPFQKLARPISRLPPRLPALFPTPASGAYESLARPARLQRDTIFLKHGGRLRHLACMRRDCDRLYRVARFPWPGPATVTNQPLAHVNRRMLSNMSPTPHVYLVDCLTPICTGQGRRLVHERGPNVHLPHRQ